MENCVAVIGCGTIGCGWATFFAVKGLETRLFDQNQETLAKACGRIRENLNILVDLGELEAGAADAAMARIHTAQGIEEAIEDVSYVQESIYEDYDAKKALFFQLDQLLPEEAVIATSSSGLLMTEIQKAAKRFPERCLTGHPINPVYLIPLVEIVPGQSTSQEAVLRAKAFYEAAGKVPVVLKKEVPGYLENRLTAALYREAIDLVIHDVATVEDVDKAIWAGPGLRYALMGPLLIYHLGGGQGGVRYFLNHLGNALTQWWSDMNTWTSVPEGAVEVLEKGIEESLQGRSVEEVCAWRDRKLVELLKIVDVSQRYNTFSNAEQHS